MKMRLLAILFLSLTSTLYAQLNTDSLWQIFYDTALSNEIRLKSIAQISKHYHLAKPDTLRVVAPLYYNLSKDLKSYENMALAKIFEAYAIRIHGNCKKARESLQLAEIYANRTLNERIKIDMLFIKVSIVIFCEDRDDLAIKIINEAEKKSHQIGYKKGEINARANIAFLHFSHENYDKALEIFNQCLKEYRDSGLDSTDRIYGSLIKNKAQIFTEMARNILSSDPYSSQGNLLLNKALELTIISENIRRATNHEIGVAHCLSQKAGIYRLMDSTSEAITLYRQAIKIYERRNYFIAKVWSLNGLGKVFIRQQKYNEAISTCDSAYMIALSQKNISAQEHICECLYISYKSLGNDTKALIYLEEMRTITDSRQAEETNKKLQQMEFQKAMLQDSIATAEESRLVQEAHEEEMRQEEKTRNWTIAAGVLALLLAGGFYSRWRYVHKSRDIISKERDRSDNLLLNILPAEITEELKENGRAEARDFDRVSILFTDFVAFTETSEKLSAKELVSEINVCFEAFDRISEKHKIEKIKTIGDAYMAAGGLPVPTDDSVKNTVLAALEMQEFIVARHKSQVSSGTPAFEMRVGIHTGPVVAGIVGVKKFQYDIWGDTVNTASRMESSGEVGKVNISQSTFELIKDDSQFQFEARGKVAAKGKGEVEMYFVSLS